MTPTRTFIAAHATAVVLAVAYSCREPAPIAELPSVRLVADPVRDEHLTGARAWEPLGFVVSLEESGLRECQRRWYASDREDAFDCQITIGIVIESGLIERTGSDAAASREMRAVYLDDDVRWLGGAVAHEVGHILLDTPLHTRGGVMGGASGELRDVDYELACETIGVCR